MCRLLHVWVVACVGCCICGSCVGHCIVMIIQGHSCHVQPTVDLWVPHCVPTCTMPTPRAAGGFFFCVSARELGAAPLPRNVAMSSGGSFITTSYSSGLASLMGASRVHDEAGLLQLLACITGAYNRSIKAADYHPPIPKVVVFIGLLACVQIICNHMLPSGILVIRDDALDPPIVPFIGPITPHFATNHRVALRQHISTTAIGAPATTPGSWSALDGGSCVWHGTVASVESGAVFIMSSY